MYDGTFERILVGKVSDFGRSACPDGGKDTVEAAIRRVVDDPARLFVFVDLGDSGIELSLVFQAIPMPELTDLIDDLVLLRVPLVPPDGGMESV